MDEIKEEYQKLAAKYKLAKYEELDKEFLISDIGKTNLILYKILEKINEKIGKYSEIIEGVLQPDGNSVSSLNETKAFAEEEKKDVFETYKKLMLWSRTIKQLCLWSDDKKNSDFLNDFFNEWKKIKTGVDKILEKIKDSWTKDIDIKENLGYFG